MEHMQRIKKEGNDAMDEFSLIVQDEEERIQQVANKEKERIMHGDMRINGTIGICPLCLEEISPIRTLDECNQGKFHAMVCCGALHCNNCANNSLDFMFGISRNDYTNAKWYNCREPVRNATYWATTIKQDDKRYTLLNALADSYINRTLGLKKNTNKAIQLYQRAAELGNTLVQDMLAQYYFYGVVIPKCLQKARYYAEKAAGEGGVRNSQYILAQLIKESDSNNSEEEVFRLYTLAAFQGSEKGRFALGMYYYERYGLMTIGDEDWRKNLLLTLYWFGKAAEVEVEKDDTKGCKSLALMALHLDVAMTQVWHPPHNSLGDSLPGYSHIPFITWALATKGGQYTDWFSNGLSDCSRWTRECGNCGCQEKEQLKACARCKAFHYCSKKCQVEHWKAGHKVDCKGHWIEKHFPAIRKA